MATKNPETPAPAPVDEPDVPNNDKEKEEEDGDEEKSDRVFRSKKAGLFISINRTRISLKESGIPRISEGTDVRAAAFYQAFAKQFILHIHTSLHETKLGGSHILSLAQTFGPIKTLGIKPAFFCVPMYSPASFEITHEKDKDGCTLPRFTTPLAVFKKGEDVMIKTKKSSHEMIHELQRHTHPGSAPWDVYYLDFEHYLTNKGKRQTLLHEKDVKTTGKAPKESEKKKKKRKEEKKAEDKDSEKKDKDSEKKRKEEKKGKEKNSGKRREREEASEKDEPLKKKQKKLKPAASQ